ncbi:MAG: DegT/DnrJ/EryC1/StrS family aminotransferase [Deltaproteobacteria bacterium]|nr:DegT/DnrJ/EryC1/StrS family aminotransferase [Deltaproteobacteria bacterium]
MIPMVDLKRQYRQLKDEIDRAVQEVLDSAQFILGPNVAGLEEEVAAYNGIPYAVGVANGTDALLMALRACGIGDGDEVITTPFTFIATAEVVAELNAVPVFVDIVPETFNIDPKKIEEKINDRTKAIIPVHLFGHPADMDGIMEIARNYNLLVIEDCAQAFGAEYRGRKVGTFGNCGCFSFFPSKNLACYGDGGMIISGDERIAAAVRMLRNHGSKQRYYHDVLGYNSRLDELQAAIVRVKLKRIDEFNELRRLNADRYCSGITRDDVILPGEEEGAKHVYHQFTLRSSKRDDIAKRLSEEDIASAVYYPVPLHRQRAFARLDVPSGGLAISEIFAGEVLSLPMFPELTEDEIHTICHVINHAV